MKVTLIITDEVPETVPRQYWPKTEALVESVRSSLKPLMYTCTDRVYRALCLLHKRQEIELTVWHAPTERFIELDINGELITPWPDEWLEHGFNMIFADDKELNGPLSES